MAVAGKNGVTSNTPKNILFGAGTIHKNLAYTAPTYSLTSDSAVVSGKTYYTRSGTSPNYTYTPVLNPTTSGLSTYYERSGGGWNFTDSIIGATSGGSRFVITPEITPVEIDGALVATKDFQVKTGETAIMEINFAELSTEIIKAATIGDESVSEDTEYDLIESKGAIESGDYFDNIAFVGKRLDGKNVIVIMDNALCTSGMGNDGRNKEAGVLSLTFTCHANIEDNENLDVLPWHIYYPKASA